MSKHSSTAINRHLCFEKSLGNFRGSTECRISNIKITQKASENSAHEFNRNREKKLWEHDSAVPDNATNEEFVQKLRRVTLKSRSVSVCARLFRSLSPSLFFAFFSFGSRVLQQIFFSEIIALAFALFYGKHSLSRAFSFSLMVLCALLYLLNVDHLNSKIFLNLKSVFVLHLILFVLAQILQSLTKSYHDHTIWILCSFCFGANVAFHDYSRNDEKIQSSIQEAVSINAAVFGVVLLSSRLEVNSDMLVFFSLSFEFLLLAPTGCHNVRKYSKRWESLLNLVLFIFISAGFYFFVEYKGLFVFSIVSFMVYSFVLPPVYVVLSNFKEIFNDPRFPEE